MNKLPLIVIEAPGKSPSFEAICKRSFKNGANVFATKGRLFDLPKNKLGVDINGEIPSVDWREIRPSLVSALIVTAKKSKEVLLVTDNDDEGHLIAWQISEAIKTLQKPIYRLELNKVSEAAFRKAYKNKTPIDYSKAEPALRRRVFDRIISFQDGRGNQNPISRVQSPIAALLSKEPVIAGEIEVQACNGWKVKADITSDKIPLMRTIMDKISALPPVEIPEEVPTTEINSTPCAYTGPDLLIDSCKTFDQSVSKCSEAIQSLYERGCISYPRTDCNLLHSDSIKKIKQLANSEGIRFKARPEHIIEHQDIIAPINHEGIHSLTTPGHINQKSTLEEKIHLLVHHRCLSIGSLRPIANKTISINDIKHHNAELFHLVSSVGENIRVEKLDTIEQRKIPPILREQTIMKTGDVHLKTKSRDLIILKLLAKHELARPSTIAAHAAKISSKFLDANSLLPTRAVHLTCHETANLAPNLASIDKSIKIKEMLQSSSKNNSITIIQKALRMASPHTIETNIGANIDIKQPTNTQSFSEIGIST